MLLRTVSASLDQFLPYRISRLLSHAANMLYWVRRQMAQRPAGHLGPLVGMHCAYEGQSGGAFAMASSASLIARHCDLWFEADTKSPSSGNFLVQYARARDYP